MQDCFPKDDVVHEDASKCGLSCTELEGMAAAMPEVPLPTPACLEVPEVPTSAEALEVNSEQNPKPAEPSVPLLPALLSSVEGRAEELLLP